MVDLSQVLYNGSKRTTASFTIEHALLDWLDETAMDSQVSKSEIVNRAIRLFIRVHDPDNRDIKGDIMIKALVKERHMQGDGNGTCNAGFQMYDRKTCNKFITITDGVLSCSQAGEDECPFNYGEGPR